MAVTMPANDRERRLGDRRRNGAEARALGLCATEYCGRPSEKYHCEEHRQRGLASGARQRAKRRAVGPTCSFQECGAPMACAGLCIGHYAQRSRGRALTTITRFHGAAARFWSRVIKSDGCWGWVGYTDKRGYAQFHKDGAKTRAHRVSWEIHNGPIPPGLCVCHHCDNPTCTKPDHLFLGTTADKLAKGRNVSNPPRGSAHVLAKLNEANVRQVMRRLRLGDRQAAIAMDYGVAPSVVSSIATRTTWRHVDLAPEEA